MTATDKPPKDYIDAVDVPGELTLKPIGILHCPYRERHGTPHQAVVATKQSQHEGVFATLTLREDISQDVLLGFSGIEYVWIISWLHLNHHYNATVIPPRGPRVRRGVLATRAPHRPNSIGLSAVRLIGISGSVMELGPVDLLDCTPVLDVKPYVPYADAFPNASAGYIDGLGPISRVDEG